MQHLDLLIRKGTIVTSTEVFEGDVAVREGRIVELSTGTVVSCEALSRFHGDLDRPSDWWFASAHLVGIGDDGKLCGLEVLTCTDGYCDLYSPSSAWRTRLLQVTHGRWDPAEKVPVVSGATQSCVHVAEGVKKMLAIHARFLPN